MPPVKAATVGEDCTPKLTDSRLFIWTSGHKDGDSEYNIKVNGFHLLYINVLLILHFDILTLRSRFLNVCLSASLPEYR
jgi:hypothetical protein